MTYAFERYRNIVLDHSDEKLLELKELYAKWLKKMDKLQESGKLTKDEQRFFRSITYRKNVLDTVLVERNL